MLNNNLISIFLFLLLINIQTINLIKNNNSTNFWSPHLIDQVNPFRLKKKNIINENNLINTQWKEKIERAKKRKKELAKKQTLSVDWQLPTPETPKTMDKIQLIDIHADINFLANQISIHKRTPIYLLKDNQCLQVNFRIEGKRTRLLLYTCNMYEGGECVLDKFLATTSTKTLKSFNNEELNECFKLKPWMDTYSPFAFHIRFLRRPRNFKDNLQRRNGWHSKREVGRIKLSGFHPCDKACESNQNIQNTELIKIQPHYEQNKHLEDPLEGYG
uniref:Uncharacterized protein n=2 Tax=Meloidogyne enterolobii TaxID=390850 RepID=A0A6V7TJ65_MELEN|nr:unnamed protein product [Meloidogyne enterolobii]